MKFLPQAARLALCAVVAASAVLLTAGTSQAKTDTGWAPSAISSMRDTGW